MAKIYDALYKTAIHEPIVVLMSLIQKNVVKNIDETFILQYLVVSK